MLEFCELRCKHEIARPKCSILIRPSTISRTLRRSHEKVSLGGRRIDREAATSQQSLAQLSPHRAPRAGLQQNLVSSQQYWLSLVVFIVLKLVMHAYEETGSGFGLIGHRVNNERVRPSHQSYEKPSFAGY
jgi:hypothetical protein